MPQIPTRGAGWTLPDLPRATEPVPGVDLETMVAADQVATDRLGIALAQLMENAGRELAYLATALLGGSTIGSRIVVLAGTGNNAGGGMVAARRLAGWGARVCVTFARPILRLRPAPCGQLEGLIASGAELTVAGHDRRHADLATEVIGADLVIDALIGYGLRGVPDDPYRSLIGMTSVASGPVLSLDIPSGIDATTGDRAAVAVSADATLALALPKRGTLIGEGRRSAGSLYLADIGIPAAVFRGLGVEIGTPFSAGPILRLD